MQRPPSKTPHRLIRRLICLLPAEILFFSFPAASGFQSSSNLQDSQSGNIKGQIVVNSAGGYPSIQEAIDLASTKGGGVVLVPSGRYIVRQIVLRYGVSLKGLGMNGAPHGEGMTLEQAEKSIDLSKDKSAFPNFDTGGNTSMIERTWTEITGGEA